METKKRIIKLEAHIEVPEYYSHDEVIFQLTSEIEEMGGEWCTWSVEVEGEDEE